MGNPRVKFVLFKVIWFFMLIGHLRLHGVWLGEELGTDTITISSCVLKEIGLRARNLLAILGSVVNMIVGSYMVVLEERESS